MRHSSHPLPLDVRGQAAWQAQFAAAGQTPGQQSDLVRRRHELFPRFTVYYTQLQALPRRVRRALQRQLGLPLAVLALWLALGQLPALAATIPVGGACTLVDALTAANTDTATGGCPAGSGADTIVLPPGSIHTLTSVHNNTYGPTGLPVSSSVITIAGQGSTIARDTGAPEFRLLAVSNTGALTLQDTTVSGGIAPISPEVYSGGGVANYGGILTILNSTVSGNTAAKECFAFGCGGAGGGVLNYDGTLTITDSTISGNAAPFGSDGGVENFGGTVTITNSTISGNAAYHPEGGSGGGVENGGGTITITDSTISGNAAPYGGGVYNGGTLTVTNSTITGNTAYYSGGGVANGGRFRPGGTVTVTNSTITGNTAFDGGGVFNRGAFGPFGTLTITDSTISGNAGGGVANGGRFRPGGTVTVTNSTITGNGARYNGSGGGVFNRGYKDNYGYIYTSTLILARTLISGNTAPTVPEIFNDPTYSTVVVDAHNLFGLDGAAGVEGFEPGPTDVVPPAGVLLSDILDPALTIHGGRTETHALVPGSPAIDAGGPVCLDANGDPLLTDQRGKPRPVDGDEDGIAACDIGAFEFFPLVNDFVTLDPDLDTGFDPTPVPDGPAGTFTITATFTNTSETPLRFPFFEVTALSGGNLLLNADGDPGGVGATLTPEVGDRVLSPGEAITVDFVMGLHTPAPFTCVVELFGEPVPPAAGEPSRPLTGDATAMVPLERRSSDAPTAGAPARPPRFRFALDPTARGARGR